MYKVFIAEDEISSMKYIEKIIEKKCPDFEIIGEAEDGAEALKKLETLSPDILITDIRMPLVNGIELITETKERYPSIRSIIISGYSEFDYAQRAIKAGAVDYLLKPINVRELVKILENIREQLDKAYWDKQIEIWYAILNKHSLPQQLIQNTLQSSLYHMVLIRRGGLPKRFGQVTVGKLPEYNLDGYQIAEKYRSSKEVWTLAGRDENEIIVVCGKKTKEETDIKSIVSNIHNEFAQGRYCTLIYYGSLVKIEKIYAALQEMYTLLNECSVIGKDQTQTLHNTEDTHKIENEPDVSIYLKKMEHSLRNGNYTALKNDFIKMFSEWENEEKPERWLERALHQVLTNVSKFSPRKEKAKSIDYIDLMGESLNSANSFGELMAEVWDIIELLTDKNSAIAARQDVESIFGSIEAYINNHYAEPLSLQSVCASFGISQTYLSRIFRKYKKTSFNDYLTSIRIECAKKIILDNPYIKLKEVSSLVGYVDPSYFSKVFRSWTGVPPSEFGKIAE